MTDLDIANTDTRHDGGSVGRVRNMYLMGVDFNHNGLPIIGAVRVLDVPKLLPTAESAGSKF